MATDRENFYERTAKRLAASTIMYGVDSVVHVEDVDDIWFWRQFLHKYRPGRYKFYPATTNENNNRVTGCAQCLKYKDYLSQKFFICIDSDLRYLLDEDIYAERGILQTYTYSWENHCCFAERLQAKFNELTGKGDVFDFVVFLQKYSDIVYEPFLMMLYQERNGLTDFGRDKFRRIISLTYRKGDEVNNGEQFLNRLYEDMSKGVDGIDDADGFNLETESEYYALKGVGRDNVYLYVRGHCLYNALVSIGRKLCEGTGVDFEQNILKSELAYERYDAISRIKSDIGSLRNLRKI